LRVRLCTTEADVTLVRVSGIVSLAAAAVSRTSPAAAAEVSPVARAKAPRRQTDDGKPVHSFRTLLADLATLTRNTLRFGDALPITVLSRPTPIQQRAFDLLAVALVP
jgi:hypothetical protein